VNRIEESIRERLEFWKESHTKIEVRKMTGKTYQGNIDILGKEYFCLHQDPNTHIFIDKIESIKEVY